MRYTKRYPVKMQILLSDASGLTSRQVATILSRKGHTVHVLSTSSIPLTRFTRHVSKVHRMPPFGSDPYLWLDVALKVLNSHAFDVLLCTQEQVAIISAEEERFRQLGVHFAVPKFEVLRRVFDKVSAYDTLNLAGLLQPESLIVGSAAEMSLCSHLLPAYIKTPLGTASAGVQFVETNLELQNAFQRYANAGSFIEGGQLLVQKAVKGPLLMISAVFHQGHLIAWHSCLRVKEGMGGGASKKSSLPLPQIGEHLTKLGAFLKWHGAISLDGILRNNEVFYIDVNPRIVEPINALYSGVDLVGALLEISVIEKASIPKTMPIGEVGVDTHQLLLAILKAGTRGRVAVLREALQALFASGSYQNSVEELTPLQGDIISLVLMCSLILVMIIGGSTAAEMLAQDAVSSYALGRNGWQQILKRTEKIHHTCT